MEGLLKRNMLGFNPNNFIAAEKGVRIRRLKGPEGVKGPTGGPCDLLTIINSFNIAFIGLYCPDWIRLP